MNLKFCILTIAFFFCFKMLLCAESEKRTAVESRKKRFLIYPRFSTMRSCFILGLGVPVEELEIETVVVGYVLRTQNFLPYNITQLYTKNYQAINSRKAPDSIIEPLVQADEEVPLNPNVAHRPMFENFRWTLYKAIETFADQSGIAGRDCVLKSICEAASVPFDSINGLLGELLHIFLTPSTSNDDLTEHADNDFFQAEHLGRTHADCHRVYTKCPRSMLARVTDIQQWGSAFWDGVSQSLHK